LTAEWLPQRAVLTNPAPRFSAPYWMKTTLHQVQDVGEAYKVAEVPPGEKAWPVICLSRKSIKRA
jgi:hypothetical protein